MCASKLNNPTQVKFSPRDERFIRATGINPAELKSGGTDGTGTSHFGAPNVRVMTSREGALVEHRIGDETFTHILSSDEQQKPYLMTRVTGTAKDGGETLQFGITNLNTARTAWAGVGSSPDDAAAAVGLKVLQGGPQEVVDATRNALLAHGHVATAMNPKPVLPGMRR